MTAIPNNPKYHREPNSCVQFLEDIRWKINLFFVFQPFACVAHCGACTSSRLYTSWWNPLRNLHRLTVGRAIVIGCLIGLVIRCSLVLQGVGGVRVFRRRLEDDDVGGFGSLAEYILCLSFLLGARYSLFNLFFALSFENAMFYHKWSGRSAVLMAAYHGLTFGQGLLPLGGGGGEDGENFTGAMVVLCGLLIVLSSLFFVRRKLFEIFVKLHWVLFVMIAIFSVAHGAAWVGFGLFMTGVDVLIRAFVIWSPSMSVKVLEVSQLPGNVIRIVFEKKSFKYEAGQYVFLCIPAIALTEWHPFSMSTSPYDDTVMIHIRVLGDWTRKLHRFAAANDSRKDWSDFNIFVEGPFGRLTVPLHNYESVVLLSGGIGITPMQSIFNQIIFELKAINDGSTGAKANASHLKKLKRLHFVWVVRDPSMVSEFGKRHWAAKGIHVGAVAANNNNNHDEENPSDANENANNDAGNNTGGTSSAIKSYQRQDSKLPAWFSPDLLIIDAGSTMIGECEIVTEFYLTRVKDEQEQATYSSEFPFLRFGRPNIAQILCNAREEYDKANADGCASACSRTHCGLTALTCGPARLVYDVTKYSAVYGIDCHTETFEF